MYIFICNLRRKAYKQSVETSCNDGCFEVHENKYVNNVLLILLKRFRLINHQFELMEICKTKVVELDLFERKT
ncbi:MAG: hypothetical protein ACTS6G_04780 [Candidatus Hodgkinia cicadicola]